MSTCESLRADAAGVASLPAGDPEREAFLAHAAGCPGCLGALREAEAVLRLLDAVPAEPPSPAALQRASAQIRAELRLQRFAPALRAGAAVAAWALALAAGRSFASDAWTGSVAMAGLAAALASLIGVPRFGALGAALAAGGLALAAGGMPGGLNPGGLQCFAIEQLCALLPAATAVWLARQGGALSAPNLAEAAAAGALAGASALHVVCPEHHVTAHLWAFHVGGVLVATALAAAAARPLRRLAT